MADRTLGRPCLRIVMMILMACVQAALFLWGLNVAGCGQDTRDKVVARIGDRRITIGELWQFQDSLENHLKSDTMGVDAQRDYLQSMIDRELMLREVYESGLDRDPAFLERLEYVRQAKLAEAYRNRNIAGPIQVTDEEIRERFERDGLDREIELAQIVVRTREDAEALMRRLKSGERFDVLARTYSLDPRTRDRGGRTGKFIPASALRSPVREAIVPLTLGEFTEPVELHGGHYLFTVAAERAVTLMDVASRTRWQIRFEKVEAEERRIVADLRGRFHPRLNPEGIQVLIRSVQERRSPSIAERRTPIYVYDGGEVSVGAYMHASLASQLPVALMDSVRMVKFGEEYVLPGALLGLVAVEEGMEEDPMIAGWLALKREDLLLSELRRTRIGSPPQITDEDARTYYDRHAEAFVLQPVVVVQEILVEGEDFAQRLRERIERGANVGELASRYTVRSGMRAKKGRLELRPLDRQAYGPLVELAFSAAEESLIGPVELRDRGTSLYSMFRVIEKSPPRRAPFGEVERQVRSRLMVLWQEEQFARFMKSLRAKYESIVEISEEDLADAARRE